MTATRRLLRSTGLVFLPLILAALAPLAAQQEVDAFTDVVDVRVVNIEVVVTDKDGRPVIGLERDDFQIFANGKPLELTNFFEMSSGDTPLAGERLAGSQIAPENATDGLTAAIIVDNGNIRPENRKALFDRLREYLREQNDTDIRYMVASMGRGMKIEVPLTSDEDRVFGALGKIERQASLHAAFDGQRKILMSRMGHASLRRYQPPQGAVFDLEFDDAIRVAQDLALTTRTLAEQRYQTTKNSYGTLAYLAQALAGLPGRKALLYLSDGLPLRPADSLLEAWTGKYQNWVLRNEDDIRLRSRYPEAVGDFRRFMTTTISSQFDLQSQLNRLVTTASSAKVAFYPVSAGGRSSTLVSAEVSGAGMHGDVGAGGMYRNSTNTENFTRDASLLRMAEDTGGTALLRSTNIGDFIDRVKRDFTNYYSLGFTPDDAEVDGRLRDLTIKVADGQFKVRHPKGYVAKTWRQELGERTAAAAVHSQESNPLGVRIDPGEESRDGDWFLVPVMIKIPFEFIQLVHKDDHFNAQVTVLVLVSDSDGGLSQTHRIDLPIKVPDSRVLEALEQVAAYPLELKMKKGRKRLAVGVRDHISGSESAVNLEIDVGRGVQIGG